MNWIKSHEVAIIALAAAIGGLVYGTVPAATGQEIAAVAAAVGAFAHLVDRAVQAFLKDENPGE